MKTRKKIETGPNPNGVPAEVEAKLALPDPSRMVSLARLREIGPYRIVPRDTVRLFSVYWDTDDLALTRHGGALRTRRERGHWELTAKWQNRVSNGLHRRAEVTVPLPGRPAAPLVLPTGVLRDYLSAILAGRSLRPILTSDIRRQRLHVERVGAADRDGAVAELDLDRVRLAGPDRGKERIVYCEVEIEKQNGRVSDVSLLSELLVQKFSLEPSPVTKFERGMRMLYGPSVLDVTVAPIATGDTVVCAVRKLFSDHLKQLRLFDPAARKGEDPEAVHQMRVAVRRMRSILRAFPEAFSSRQQRRFTGELRWLGQALGGVRDLDVQLERLERDSIAIPAWQRAALNGYLEALRLRKQASVAELRQTLELERYLGLLLSIEKFSNEATRRQVAGPRASQLFVEAGRASLKKLLHKFHKSVRADHSTTGPEEMHEIRIRAKRVRYLLESLSHLTGKKGYRLERCMAKVQSVLGRYRDEIIAADMARQYAESLDVMAIPTARPGIEALARRSLARAKKVRVRFEERILPELRQKNVKLDAAVLRRLKRMAHGGMGPVPRSKSTSVEMDGKA